MGDNENGWSENKKLIRHQLEQLEVSLDKINERLSSIESKIWVLQVKAAGIGGFVAVITSYLMGKM